METPRKKRFNVSQVRLAGACPRAFYFDFQDAKAKRRSAGTARLFSGDNANRGACGAIFHRVVENFQRNAENFPELVANLQNGVDRDQLQSVIINLIFEKYGVAESLASKSGEQQRAFFIALRTYCMELADLLIYAASQRGPTSALFDVFGDDRRSLSVNFPLESEHGQRTTVEVAGELDFVFYDVRKGQNQIIDYKLTDSSLSSRDVLQAVVYALMHDKQHGGQPNAAVLYLHPERKMLYVSWKTIDEVWRPYAEGLFQSMAAWCDFDEVRGVGLRPYAEPAWCGGCSFQSVCEARLGPKTSELAPILPVLHLREDSENSRQVIEPPEKIVPETMLTFGQWKESNKEVSAPLSGLRTHIALVGAAGSGKTWLGKVIAQQAAAAGVAVVAVDLQGDIVQFLQPRPIDEIPAHYRQEYNRFHRKTLVNVWTPGGSLAKRLQLDPIRLPNREQLQTNPDFSPERREEVFESMVAAVANNLVGLTSISKGKVRIHETLLMQLLTHMMKHSPDQIHLADIVQALAEPEAVGMTIANELMSESDRKKFSQQLNILIYGPSKSLFSGGTPLDMATMTKPGANGETPINIIYLNAMSSDDQKQAFVASLATEIYRWMISTSADSDRPRLLFYLDEAKLYVPAGMSKPPAKEPILRLLREGRKFGVGCLLCTQSPRSIDYTAVGNCSMKIVGRVESPQDAGTIDKWFDSQERADWVSQRAGAEAGTFVARWMDMPAENEGAIFKSRGLFVAHGAAWSPEKVEAEWRRVSQSNAESEESAKGNGKHN